MCNCKKKPTINEEEAIKLIKEYAIDGATINSVVRDKLYTFYDQLNNTITPKSCTMCWDDYVKQNLIDVYITKV